MPSQFKTDSLTYASTKGAHAYNVEAFYAGSSKDRVTFWVSAANRDQASRRVERDGHRVVSVNMVG